MQLIPLHEEFGITIAGIDFANPVDDASWSMVIQAMEQHSLVLLREQQLDDELQLDLTRRIGTPEEEHVSYYSRGEIQYLGTVDMWHSDSSFREVPSSFSLLFAHEVPAEGGETEFVSTRAAYSRLDETLQNKIDPLVGIHDYIFSRTKVSEDAVTNGQREFMYPVRQKLVRTNSHTGEKNFFIGSHVRDIVDWQQEDSRPLLDNLLEEATRPQSVYRHEWQAGDLLIWDNRCILHRGCGYDADKYRRYMRQTRVRGQGPTLAE